MAICRFLGTSNDWTNVANWSGAAVPVALDEVFFTDNAQSVTANVDQNLINLDLLYVSPTYSGSLGANGAHLILDSIDDFYYAGTGTASYVETDDAVNGIGLAVVANTGAGADALHLTGLVQILNLLKGRVTIETGSDVPSIEVGYVSSLASDATLNIAAAVTLSVIVQTAGVITNLSNIATVTVAGGTYNHGTTDVAITAGAIAQLGSSTVNYYSTGAITSLNVRGGTFNASSTRGPLTIGAINIWKDGTVNLANGQKNITVTNGIRNYGGRVILDPGQQMDVVVL